MLIVHWVVRTLSTGVFTLSCKYTNFILVQQENDCNALQEEVSTLKNNFLALYLIQRIPNWGASVVLSVWLSMINTNRKYNFCKNKKIQLQLSHFTTGGKSWFYVKCFSSELCSTLSFTALWENTRCMYLFLFRRKKIISLCDENDS